MIRRWHLSVVAALTLVVTACGGGAAPASPSAASKAPAPSSVAPGSTKPSAPASSAPASSASASAAAKPATGSPYVLGVDTSLTGPYSILGVPLKAGLDFEIKRVNDAGGLDGHPLKMVFMDDKSDPTQGVANFKSIADQHPVALIGPSFSSISMAIQPLVNQAKVPEIVVSVPLAPDDPYGKKMPKYVFESPQAPIPEATAILDVLKKSGATNVAWMGDANVYSQLGLNSLKIVAPTLGMKIVEAEQYNLTDTDLTPQLTKIKNNPEVQALVEWATGPAAVALDKNFHALGMKMPLVFTITQNDPSFRKATQPASDGDLMQNNKSGLLTFLPDSDPMKKVALDWRKAYQDATGQDPTSPLASYDPLHLLMNAIHVAGSTDPDKIVNALETTKWVGINGTYAYSPTSHVGLGLDSNVIAVIKKGELAPYKYQCDGCAKVNIPS